MSQKWSYIGLVLLSVLLVWFRLVPHTANAIPILAVLLIAASLVGSRWCLLMIPFTSLLISDWSLGFYPGWPITYLGYAFILLVGAKMQWKLSSLFGSGLAAAMLFFLASNIGVFFSTGLYEQSFEGFVQCFAAAIPFFRTTLISTFLGLGVTWISWEGLQCLLGREQLVKVDKRDGR